LANTLKDQANFKGAEASYKKAISLKPDFAEAYNNLGILYLAEYDFPRGFDLCEWRWKDQTYDCERLLSAKPDWSGEHGKTVFVWSEQGVGDVLMFATILKELQEISAAVIFRCDQRLVPLFERSFSGNISFIPGNDTVVPESSYDYHIPIGSLPRIFRHDLKSFEKGAKAFLKADPNKVKHLKEILHRDNEQPICGISWRGGKKGAARLRSIDLPLLANTLSATKQTLVNLQYDATQQELDDLKTHHNIEIITLPEIDNFNDLDGLAALICACDKIVSVDNTTVHLAGVLGIDTHALLPFAPDWRWGRDSKTSYWYESVSLHRQHKISDWSEPLKTTQLQLR
jgi:tetratricopeptide (TPR) repeat protein